MDGRVRDSGDLEVLENRRIAARAATPGSARGDESRGGPLSNRWIDGLVAATSLALAASQFLIGRLMSAFDSGVYFGAASQLSAGRLPYRDFAFVQPPGGLVLLSPWALVGRASTTAIGFAFARGASALVVAAVAVLLGRLLRPYGRVASLVGGMAVALAPPVVFEMTSVKLESYCLFLSLLAAWWVSDAQSRALQAVQRRIGAAGLVIGVAGSVKLWAFLPFVALVACVWRMGPPLATRFVLWAGVGFGLVAGPFFLLAPKRFLTEVFVAQWQRPPNVLGNVSTLSRLSQMTGLGRTPFALDELGLVVLYGTLALVVAMALVVGGRRSLVEHFFVVSSVVTTLALLLAKEFYGYYGYFLVPLVVGLTVSSAVRLWRWGCSRWGSPLPNLARPLVVAGRTLAAVIVTSSVAVSFYSVHHLSEVAAGASTPTAIDHFIAPGSCVIFDDAIQGVLANRFVSSSPSCPIVVDAGGLSMTLGGGHPLRSSALASEWHRNFLGADYVVLAGLTPLGIPWTRSLYSWFVQHFRVIFNGISYVIYRRR